MNAPERDDAEARLLAARLRELRARSRWNTTLNEVQDRTSARTLTNKAIEELRETGGEIAARAMRKIRERPMTVAAIVGAALLFLFRKPLARGARALISRRRATREADHPLDAQIEETAS